MSGTLTQSLSSAQRGFNRRTDIRWAIAVCGGLAVAILILFGRTLGHGFCNVDDFLFVCDEPHVSGGLSWSGIVWTFTNGPLGEWYPLSMLSHLLDCQLYGLHPAGHHLTNLLLHIASTVMLFLLLWRMTGELWPSAMVAALFALHPLHVEPVAWIAARRDVLSALFFMLTLAAYGEYVRHPRSLLRYLAVLGFFALGLMSKPMLVTTPLLLLLLDYWPLGRFHPAQPDTAASGARPAFPWRVVLDKLPLLALALADAAVTMRTHGLNADSLTFSQRLANAVISYVVYLGQLFVPIGLSIFSAYPGVGRPVWQVAAGLALLLAITAAAVFWRRSCPYFLVGWFWYLVALVPVIGLVYVGPQSRADRYTYISQIGLYIVLVWGVARLTVEWPDRRRVLAIGAGFVLAAMMVCSWRQIGFWQTDRSLWEHALACDPKNITARSALGCLVEDPDPNTAATHYRQTLEMGANERNATTLARVKAHNGLGNIADRRGDYSEAIDQYQQALDLDPSFTTAQTNIGRILVKQGKLDEALEYFQRSVAQAPDNAVAACCMAVALAQQGKTDEAIANFRKAVTTDPNFGIAHSNLALLLADRPDDVDEAIAHFRRAIELNPDIIFTYQQLAHLLKRQGKTSEAAEYDELGKKASRRYAEARNLQGIELAQQGKTREAISQFESAIVADPDFVDAHNNLGDAFALQGDTGEAIGQFRRALEIDPNFAPAKRSLRQLSDR